MANAKIGEDLKIFKPLDENVRRQLQGLSTKQGQAEHDLINTQIGGNIGGTANALAKAEKNRIGGYAGSALAEANMGDINTRKQRLLNEYNSGLSVSERSFKDAIKTKGLSNALDMFTSQLGAQTNVDVAGMENKAKLTEQNQNMAFLGQQSELDRILSREQLQGSLKLEQMQRSREKKKSAFGLLGNILGFAAAPFTGGASLALPASRMMAGGVSNMAGGGLLGRY